MDKPIYSIDDYYKLLELQKRYEAGYVDEDGMTLEEINELIKLYKSQIKDIGKRLTRELYGKSGDIK